MDPKTITLRFRDLANKYRKYGNESARAIYTLARDYPYHPQTRKEVKDIYTKYENLIVELVEQMDAYLYEYQPDDNFNEAKKLVDGPLKKLGGNMNNLYLDLPNLDPLPKTARHTKLSDEFDLNYEDQSNVRHHICQYCLKDLEQDEKYVVLECYHWFCVECFDKYRSKWDKCPKCEKQF